MGVQPLVADVGRRGHHDPQHDLAALRELERIRQQVLQDLLEPLDVGPERGRNVRRDLDAERDLVHGRDLAERALDVVLQLGEPLLIDIQRDRAGLDLGQIEHIVDQRQQVVACRMDRLRVFDLLGRQVARRVVAEQLREDQQAVQRRAQFMRHVREELGLVA